MMKFRLYISISKSRIISSLATVGRCCAQILRHIEVDWNVCRAQCNAPQEVSNEKVEMILRQVSGQGK